jgi:hypothetical protein
MEQIVAEGAGVNGRSLFFIVELLSGAENFFEF